MKISFLDLHRGTDPTEPDKIVYWLSKYSETYTTRLFSLESISYDPSSYDGIVISGSDNPELLETEQVVTLKPKLIDASKSGVNILGICGGNQLLGSYFGHKRYWVVLRNSEVGWPEVYLTERGKNDPLFHELPPVIRPFQYHNKGVRVADESLILARSERFIQSVVYAPRVRGIQFHPEDSPESGMIFLQKSEKYGDEESKSPPQNYVEWKIFSNFVFMVENNLE